jgi:ABC-type uncharacterized transport system permease subunit
MILAIPSPLGVALGIATAVAYGFVAAAGARLSRQSTQWALGIAWLLHAAVLAHGLVGSEPRFGFAPALSVTAWLVLTVYAVESRMYPQLKVRRALAWLGAAAVLLAILFPGTPLHVAASPWLPLHLALGIASYGLFGAAVVHAWLITRAEKQIRLATAEPQGGVPLLTLERLTFRFVTAGFVLLSATLLAGLLFSEQLYGAAGRAWKWDHKTIFSVLAWITFAILLVGRPASAGAGARRAACCTPARPCCCWPMWARASCSKWCSRVLPYEIPPCSRGPVDRDLALAQEPARRNARRNA